MSDAIKANNAMPNEGQPAAQAGAVVELTDANFDALVLKSAKPVMVDFWASWCGPCTAVAPVVAAIAAEKADVLSVGKLNVDEQMAIAQRYRVMSIPTIMLFKNGEVAAVSVGAAPKEEILKRFEAYL